MYVTDQSYMTNETKQSIYHVLYQQYSFYRASKKTIIENNGWSNETGISYNKIFMFVKSLMACEGKSPNTKPHLNYLIISFIFKNKSLRMSRQFE